VPSRLQLQGGALEAFAGFTTGAALAPYDVQVSDSPYRSVNVLFLPTPDERMARSPHIVHSHLQAAGTEV
jgi:hypothetical protein